MKRRSVFVNSMIYLNYLKPNAKTYKYEIILVQVKVNLKLGTIIIKSYSDRFDEIAADLSNSYGT